MIFREFATIYPESRNCDAFVEIEMAGNEKFDFEIWRRIRGGRDDGRDATATDDKNDKEQEQEKKHLRKTSETNDWGKYIKTKQHR